MRIRCGTAAQVSTAEADDGWGEVGDMGERAARSQATGIGDRGSIAPARGPFPAIIRLAVRPFAGFAALLTITLQSAPAYSASVIGTFVEKGAGGPLARVEVVV